MKKIIKPNALKRGDNLGIIALSTSGSSLKKEYRLRAIRKIEKEFGLNCIFAKNVDLKTGHTAGSILDRVDSLHEFFKRKDIHGIMSFWGGYNTHQIIEYLNFGLIKKNPKILIGYSDTTNLLTTITNKTGLVTFNGPALITFAKPNIPTLTVNAFKDLLMNSSAKYSYGVSKLFSDNPWWEKDEMIFSKNRGLKVFRKGKASGQIFGGNMGTLLLLAGTPYFPDLKNKILFLEEDESEKPQTLNRFFTQMRQMGVFKKIKGLVIGRFSSSVGLTKQDSLEMILEDALLGSHFPVITGFDMGHTDPLLTVPMGVNVQIDTELMSIQLLENCVQNQRR